MSKATCMPHREEDKYTCEICGETHQPDWHFAFLVTRRTLEADKHDFNKERNQDFVLCGKCLDRILLFIKKQRRSERYFELRCKRLEAQPSETGPSFEIRRAQILESQKLLVEKGEL